MQSSEGARQPFVVARQAAKRASHYTAPVVVSAMYEAVERLGFTGGQVLEPAVSLGHFFGLMPEATHVRSKLTSIELDELWSFAGSKQNARWVWIALCRQTRQIGACFVGDRSVDAARAVRERISPASIAGAPRVATSGWRLARSFSGAPTAAPARARAKPATSNVGTALCVSVWVALCAGHSPFPSATGCANWLCACSFIITICLLANCHYRQFEHTRIVDATICRRYCSYFGCCRAVSPLQFLSGVTML